MSVVGEPVDHIVPTGVCLCGCGRKTRVPTCNNAWKGDVRGVPKLFVHGHKRRFDTQQAVEFEPEDRGYLTPCWIWRKSMGSLGYGRVWSPDRRGHQMAHRVVFERERGPIPAGRELHHLCSVPACVNPDHLTPLSRREHMALERRLAYGNPMAEVSS